MSEREIDALVAKHVMGWTPWRSPCVPRGVETPDCWRTGHPTSPTLRISGWRPAENIAGAWRVVEQLLANPELRGSITFGTSGHWIAEFWARETGDRIGHATANTAPMAICLAALKAHGVTPDQQNPTTGSTKGDGE